MNFKFIFISFIFLTIQVITNEINANSYCLLESIGNKNDQAICNEKYKTQCDANYCSVDQVSCDNLRDLKFMIKIGKKYNMEESELKIYSDFMKSIKKCSNELKIYNLCFNNRCIHNGNCTCDGSFKFKCTKNYCARSKIECEKILRNLKNRKNKKIQIEACFKSGISKLLLIREKIFWNERLKYYKVEEK